MGPGADGVRSDVRLTVGPGGRGGGLRLHEMKGAAPLAWRLTPDAVYMVGTAASPVGLDHVTVTVRVLAGASVTVRSVAASVIWSGTGSRLDLRATVEAGAELAWSPEPLIATAGCAHRQQVSIDVHPSSRLTWREIILLGRQGERPGGLNSSLRITVGGAPLFHQKLSVGVGQPGWDSAAVVGRSKVLGQLVVAAAGIEAISPAAGTTDRGSPPGTKTAAAWSVSPLSGPGAVATVRADGMAAAEAAMTTAETVLAAGYHGGYRFTSTGIRASTRSGWHLPRRS